MPAFALRVSLTRFSPLQYGAASYVPAIVLERRLFMRERADGLYYAITYLLAKLLDELMLATLASLPLCAASFYAISFQNSFVLFWIVYLLVLYIGVVLAYAIAAISPNMDVANALLPVWVTIQLLWAGFVSSTRASACALALLLHARLRWRVAAARAPALTRAPPQCRFGGSGFRTWISCATPGGR